MVAIVFVCVCQTPHQAPGQPFKFTIPESLDRIKEEFQFLQAQYHRWIMQTHTFSGGLLRPDGRHGDQFSHCHLPCNAEPHPNHSHPTYHNEENPSSGLMLTHKPGLGSHTLMHTYAADPGISVSAHTAVGLSLGDG